MATDQEILQQTLDQGGNLLDAAAKLAEAQQAAGTNTVPIEKPAGEAAPATDGDWKSRIPAEYHQEIENIRRGWESGATPKFQKAAEWEAFRHSMESNAKGTLLYLREKYGVDLGGDEPRRSASPETIKADDGYLAQEKAARERMNAAKSVEEHTAALDELIELKSERKASARVQPIQTALVSQAEEQEIAALEADPTVRQLGLNVRQLLPQIKAYQREVQRAPYVKVREALHVVAGPQMAAELAAAKSRDARPKATQAEKASGTVAGGGAASPQGVSIPLDKVGTKDMERMLTAAGFRNE